MKWEEERVRREEERDDAFMDLSGRLTAMLGPPLRSLQQRYPLSQHQESGPLFGNNMYTSLHREDDKL